MIHKHDIHEFPSNYSFACDLCDHRFLSEKGLQAHKLVKHKVKITLSQKSSVKHQCRLCQYSHNKLSALNTHYKRKHGVNSKKLIMENVDVFDDVNDDVGSDHGTSMQGNRDDDFTSLNCDDYEIIDEEEN